MGPRIRATATGLVFAVVSLPLLAGCALGTDVVPEPFRDDVRRAGRECPEVSARLIAAQIEQESGWDPGAISSQGAQGIAQFMPETWSAWGTDADGDGTADPFNEVDAIRSQGRLMCHLTSLARESGIDGEPVELALAAYNAGWGPVVTHGGVPPYPETEDYVTTILERKRVIRLTEE